MQAPQLPSNPTFAVLGCVGEHNAGDEGLFLACVQQLQARWPAARVIAFSNDVEHTRRSYGVEAVSALSMMSLGTIVPAIRQGVIVDALRTIASCDCLVVCGGELIRTDFGMKATLSIFDRVLVARVLGKPRVFLGVGAGGLDDERQLRMMRFAAKDAPILAREAESARRLEDAGIGLPEVACDLALLLRPKPPEITLPDTPWCAVSLRDPATTKSCRNMAIGREELVDQLAAAVDHIVEHLRMVPVFLPFGLAPDDDRRFHRLVHARMRLGSEAILVEEEMPVDGLLGAIGQASLVLGMRLHASVFAINQCVPAVGIAYDPKVRKQYEYFGIEDFCIPIAMPGLIPSALDAAAVNSTAIRGKLASRLAGLRTSTATSLDRALGLASPRDD
jgi:polysaccharide pyruvyl transferase WcaK-like protein